MTEATVLALPPAQRRRVWSRRQISVVLGLFAIAGCTTWSLWSSRQSIYWSTVTVIVRNDVNKQPVPGVALQFHDLNHGFPVLVPHWISQRNPTHRWENPVTTDSLGMAIMRIPKNVRTNERIRFGISVNVLSIPRGLAYRTQEGRLFDDDPIVIWLKPNTAVGMKGSSISISSPPTIEGKTPLDSQ